MSSAEQPPQLPPSPQPPQLSAGPAAQEAPDWGTSSTGLDPKIAAMLSYLVGWVTGLIFYVIERDNRYVRFHAMQSIIGLGGLWAIGLGFWILAVLMLFVTSGGFGLMMRLAQLVWLMAFIAWLICLFKAYSGEWWKLPVAGDLAERVIEGKPRT
jgi:uncharacterized membrane protein